MSGTVVKANAGNGGEGGVKVSSLTQKEQAHNLKINKEKELALMEEQQREFAAKVKAQAENRTTVTKLNPLIKVKRKRKVQESGIKKQKEEPIEDALGLLAGYGSDSDSD
jgi:hypothetical protein